MCIYVISYTRYLFLKMSIQKMNKYDYLTNSKNDNPIYVTLNNL